MSVKQKIQEFLSSGEELYQNKAVGKFLKTVKFTEVKNEGCVSDFNKLVTKFEGEPQFENTTKWE